MRFVCSCVAPFRRPPAAALSLSGLAARQTSEGVHFSLDAQACASPPLAG
jgi:hypothetical protein